MKILKWAIRKLILIGLLLGLAYLIMKYIFSYDLIAEIKLIIENIINWNKCLVKGGKQTW